MDGCFLFNLERATKRTALWLLALCIFTTKEKRKFKFPYAKVNFASVYGIMESNTKDRVCVWTPSEMPSTTYGRRSCCFQARASIKVMTNYLILNLKGFNEKSKKNGTNESVL